MNSNTIFGTRSALATFPNVAPKLRRTGAVFKKGKTMNPVLPSTRRNGAGNADSPSHSQTITIKPPNLQTALFSLRGLSPLVIHRFSKKVMQELLGKMEEGKTSNSKKKRLPVNTDDLFHQSRYISKQGWDGFHAAAIRNGCISCCRLVDYKMTLAKMSIFVEADGWDQQEPQIPLIRIYGTPVKQMDVARVATGGRRGIVDGFQSRGGSR